MKLLINADDFGFSKGVNYGILEGFKQGTITSTSMMVNMPAFEHAVELMKQYPELLNVGLHLVTSVEYSICKGLKTLTDENGHFHHNEQKIANADIEEVRKEYQAQMDKFLETGFKPTHIDWHWCHTPVQMQVAMEMAVKYNLPLRAHGKEREEAFTNAGIKYVANHYNEYYNHDQKNPTTTPDNLISILQKRLDEGCTEMSIMVHPAYVDTTLMRLSSYNVIRATELEALLDPRVIAFIKANNIEMISYKNI